MDESKKRPVASSVPTTPASTTSVRVAICDRATPTATTVTTVTPSNDADVTATRNPFQQVQCKLSDGPTSSASRENVLPGLSRRSSRDNNGVGDDRMSVSSATSRGVRPDWANPSVSVVESVAVLQVDLVPDLNSTGFAKQTSLEKRASEEKATVSSKPCNNGSINSSSSNAARADLHNNAATASVVTTATPATTAAAAASSIKSSHTKASPQNSSSASSPTARRPSASSASAVTPDSTPAIGHPEQCV